MRRGVKSLSAIVFVTAAVSACAPAPAPLPPPPPAVVIVPPAPPPPPSMPLPPGGAALSTVVPPFGADGVRVTPNRGISSEEQIWHLRAALNVAALACQGPVWDEISRNYNQYITLHKARLAQTTKLVDADFVKRYPGRNGLRVRDTKMTELYNYFALPPVHSEFCDVSLAKTRELIALPTASLPTYSVTALGEVDGVFIRFYNAFEQYQRDLADWNLRYGPQAQMIPASTTPTTAPVKPTTR